jgi:uncharacterized membrane protein YidH (DUF202 family)
MMTDPAKPPSVSSQDQTALSRERTGLSHERTDLSRHRTDLSEDRTKLSVTRTLVSLDRTLMAWVRTATSLISFGFTIYKVFDEVLQQRAGNVQRLVTPRALALVLIGLGVIGLVVATVHYRRETTALHREYARYGPFRHSPSATLATLISIMGLVGFVLVVFRQ